VFTASTSSQSARVTPKGPHKNIVYVNVENNTWDTTKKEGVVEGGPRGGGCPLLESMKGEIVVHAWRTKIPEGSRGMPRRQAKTCREIYALDLRQKRLNKRSPGRGRLWSKVQKVKGGNKEQTTNE